MVHMRAHWHDRRDRAALGRRGTHEDRQIGVAREVARAANAVEHVPPAHVRRVDVPGQVHLQGGVQRDHAQLSHDRRVVGDLLGSQHQPRGEEVEFPDQFQDLLGADSQGAGARAQQSAALHQLEGGGLKNLRVHQERRNVGVRAEAGQDGVRHIADPDLQGQEPRRDAAGGHFVEQESDDVAGDGPAHLVGRVEAAQLVGLKGFHDAHDLLRIDARVRLADPLERVVEVQGVAVRRRLGDDDVRHLAGPARVEPVDLDDDLLGDLKERGRRADGIGQVNAAVGRHLAGLDDSIVDRAEEAEQHRLRDVRKVHVHEGDPAAVDLLAEGGRRLIRRTPADGLGLGEGVVDAGSGGGPAQDANLERLAGLVQAPGLVGQRPRHGLGRPRGGESAEGHHRPIRDKLRCFLGRQCGKRAITVHFVSCSSAFSWFQFRITRGERRPAHTARSGRRRCSWGGEKRSAYGVRRGGEPRRSSAARIASARRCGPRCPRR